MPEIKQYISHAEVPGPVGRIPQQQAPLEIGERFARSFEQLGAGTAALGRGIEENQARRQTTQVYADAAKYRAQRTVDLENASRNLDINDPNAVDNFADNFSKETDEQLSDLAQKYDNPQAQEHAARLHAEISADMVERANAQQQLLAGKHARTSVEGFVDNASANLVSDPTQFDSINNNFNALVDQQPFRNGADREEFRREQAHRLAQAQVRGYAVINPARTVADLDNGRWDKELSGEEKETLLAFAQRQQAARDTDFERHERVKEVVRKENARQAESEYMARIFPKTDQDRANPVSAVEIAHDFRLDAQEQKGMIGVLNESVNQELKPTRTNPETLHKLFVDMHREADDPKAMTDKTPLWSAFTKNQLSKSDLDWLNKQFDDAQTADGRSWHGRFQVLSEGVRSDFSRSPFAAVRPAGEAWARWVQDVEQKRAEYRAAGKNPGDLLDPAKPDYVGAPSVVNSYMQNPKAAMRTGAAAVTGGITPEQAKAELDRRKAAK